MTAVADMDMQETIEAYVDQEKMYNFEGPSGVRRFAKLAKALDPAYDSVDEFLDDNPGAIEAMIEWIGRCGGGSWKSNMQAGMPKDI